MFLKVPPNVIEALGVMFPCLPTTQEVTLDEDRAFATWGLASNMLTSALELSGQGSAKFFENEASGSQ